MSFMPRQVMALSTGFRILIIFVILWGLLVFLFATKISSPNTLTNDTDYVLKQMNQAIAYLDESKKRNAELKSLIDEFLNDKSVNPDKLKLLSDIEHKILPSINQQFNDNTQPVPPTEYERLRRRVRSNLIEFWNLIKGELKPVIKQTGMPDTQPVELKNKLSQLLEFGGENYRSLLNDIDQMRENDGYEFWRHKESDALSDLVQKRIHWLQNPEDCSTARKLVCRLNKGCGYGCQLHHVVYCFIMAYANERTLILKSKGWRYHKSGWEDVFMPMSDVCLTDDGKTHSNWPGHINTQVIDLPIIDSLNPRPSYLPLAIPEDLAPRLSRLHGNPIVWWVGQFLKYILRPQKQTQDMLDDARKKLGFQRPIVGVHVRRTDKVGTEASLHSIEEYMEVVDEYYNTLEMTEIVEKRRVFLASDDPKVIDEARQKYPKYDIIGDAEVARVAAVATRYSDSSLNGIIIDINLLSLSDYLVCTFSSQVCRVAYEIMQARYPDASERFKSLDDIYYYGGQNAHNRRAVLPHRPRSHDEIFLNVGDELGVAGNHWKGLSKGKNLRTNQIGLFPSFKIVDKVDTADFPKYEHVK